MNMGTHNEKRLDKDIQLHRMEDRIKEETWEYHNKLLRLLDSKVNGRDKENPDIQKEYEDVISSFGSVVAIQKNIIQLSWDIAKDTLQDAFDRCGFVIDVDGKVVKKDEY
jgi:hypothetical protein